MSCKVSSVQQVNKNSKIATKPDLSSLISGNGRTTAPNFTVKETLTLDEFNQELTEIATQYGLSLKDLKDIYSFCLRGIEKKKDDTKGNIIRFIKRVLSDYVNEKGINLQEEKIDINDLKKYFKNRKDQIKERYEAANSGLIKFLIDKGYLKLPKNKNKDRISINDISDEALADAVDKFINATIKEISSGKKSMQQSQAQIEKLRTLIDATPPSAMKRFWDATKKVLSDDKIIQQAITEMIKSIADSPELSAFLEHISSEDLEALGLSQDSIQTAIRNVADGNDPSAIINVLQATFEIVEKNAEILKSCEGKIAQYKNENPNESEIPYEQILTPEEFNVYRAINNIKSFVAGGIVGAAENNIDITDQMTKLHELSLDLDLPDFENDIYNNVNTYLETHKDEFSPEQIAQIKKRIDNQTDGRYTEATDPENASKKDNFGAREIDENTETSVSQKADDMLNRAAIIQQNIIQQYSDEKEQNTQFFVEKSKDSDKKDLAEKNTSKIKDACFRTGDVLAGVQAGAWRSVSAAWHELSENSISKFNQIGRSGLMGFFNNLCKGENNQRRFVNGASSSVQVYIASNARNYKVDEEETNANYYVKQRIEQQQKQNQPKKQIEI